jgi:hypothetical protein
LVQYKEYTDAVLDAARNAGATGATVINHARGKGLNKKKTFFGLTLEVQKDVLLFVVEEHLARSILETINDVGELILNPAKELRFKLILKMPLVSLIK